MNNRPIAYTEAIIIFEVIVIVEVVDALDIAMKSVRYTRGSFIFRYNHKPLDVKIFCEPFGETSGRLHFTRQRLFQWMHWNLFLFQLPRELIYYS